MVWVIRTPDEVNREYLRYFALPHVVGILAEIGTNALFAHFIGDDIGSHAIWISSLAYYVYHLVAWPFEERHEEGRLPNLGKFILVHLIFPLVLLTLPLGCARNQRTGWYTCVPHGCARALAGTQHFRSTSSVSPGARLF